MFLHFCLFTAGLVVVYGDTVTVCTGDTLDIQCPYDSTIVFPDAVYGRTDQKSCLPKGSLRDDPPQGKPSGDDPLLLCQGVADHAVLNRKCFGQRTCRLAVGASTFENHCVRDNMYLRATFECVLAGSIHTICPTRKLLGDLPRGFIASPNYPNPYPQNVVCRMDLIAREGTRYDVTLLDLSVENRSGMGCYDWLYVSEKEDQSRLYSYCGKLPEIHTGYPSKIQQIKQPRVEFKSNGINSTAFHGFLIMFQEVVETLKREL